MCWQALCNSATAAVSAWDSCRTMVQSIPLCSLLQKQLPGSNSPLPAQWEAISAWQKSKSTDLMSPHIPATRPQPDRALLGRIPAFRATLATALLCACPMFGQWRTGYYSSGGADGGLAVPDIYFAP